MVQADGWDQTQAQFQRSLEAAVSSQDIAVGIRNDRIDEAMCTNAGRDLRALLLAVLARIAWVGLQLSRIFIANTMLKLFAQ